MGDADKTATMHEASTAAGNCGVIYGEQHVFSLLKAMFGDARASSLADLIEGSLMLKFNKAKRKAEKEMLAQSVGPN